MDRTREVKEIRTRKSAPEGWKPLGIKDSGFDKVGFINGSYVLFRRDIGKWYQNERSYWLSAKHGAKFPVWRSTASSWRTANWRQNWKNRMLNTNFLFFLVNFDELFAFNALLWNMWPSSCRRRKSKNMQNSIRKYIAKDTRAKVFLEIRRIGWDIKRLKRVKYWWFYVLKKLIIKFGETIKIK